jgi:ribosomal protein L14
MIQNETLLQIADNSGGKYAKCIKIYGALNKKYAKVGDILQVTVKATKKIKKQTQKGKLFKAFVARTKKLLHRKDGSTINIYTKKNGIFLMAQKQVTKQRTSNELLGTKAQGVFPYETKKILKEKNMLNRFRFVSRSLI